MANPVLLVHGGAWAIPDDMITANLRGVSNALAAGWRVLERGGSAVEAVEAAVIVLEDDETFDAGRGSFLNRDAKVQLDAMVMEGSTLRAGGVAGVERLRNPVKAARKVLEESAHVYFVGEGAERFAEEHGLVLCDNSALVTPREIERLKTAKAQVQLQTPGEFIGSTLTSHDTVGAVALDANGDLAAATSTGGTLNKIPGRVGDSSIIGAGCYADNETAACSTTGWGEPFMKLCLAKHACDSVRSGLTPQTAACDSIQYMHRRLNGHGGMILLDPSGHIGIFHNTPRMAWGLRKVDDQEVGVCHTK